LFLLVIIVEKLVILGQIVICRNPTGHGLSRMLRKSEVEDSSSSKYVPPHRRHIKGKGIVICKNANSGENIKKHSNKKSLPICHHCGIIGHIQP